MPTIEIDGKILDVEKGKMIIEAADAAMYTVKNSGKGDVRLAD